jgi:hypothetical protein
MGNGPARVAGWNGAGLAPDHFPYTLLWYFVQLRSATVCDTGCNSADRNHCERRFRAIDGFTSRWCASAFWLTIPLPPFPCHIRDLFWCLPATRNEDQARKQPALRKRTVALTTLRLHGIQVCE